MEAGTLGDLVTTKLPANSDRWPDPSEISRDILDLAMVAPDRPTLRRSLGEAEDAYGPSVQGDAQAAISSLLERDRGVEAPMRCGAVAAEGVAPAARVIAGSTV